MGLFSLRSFSSCCAKLFLRDSQCSKQTNKKKVTGRFLVDIRFQQIWGQENIQRERKKLWRLIYCFKSRKIISNSEKFSRHKNNSLETQDMIKTEVALMLLQNEEFKMKLKTYGDWCMFINLKQYSLFKTRVNTIQHLDRIFWTYLLVLSQHFFWRFISPVLLTLPRLSFDSSLSEIKVMKGFKHLSSEWGNPDKINWVVFDSSYNKIMTMI